MNNVPVPRGGLSRRSMLALTGLTGAGLAGLAGCGGSDSRTSGDGVHLTFWGTTFEKDAVNETIAAFEEERDGISVDAQHIPNNNYDTKLNTLYAANTPPDASYMGINQAFTLAEQGKLVNVLSFVDKYPELGEFMDPVYFYWDEGKAISSWALETILLWYDKDAFVEADIEPPPATADEAWSWDEFLDVALRMTLDRDGNNATESGFDPENIERYGLFVPNLTSFHLWYPLLLSNGGSLTNEAGTEYALDSSAATEVFQNLQDLIYTHHVLPTPAQLGSTPPTTTSQLESKRAAMAIDGQWQLLDLGQSSLNYGVGVLPSYQEPTTLAVCSAMVVPEASKRKEEALELLVYLSRPENVTLYETGLWMPGLQEYYNDESAIDKWLSDDVHPEEYRTAVVDYMRDHGESDYHRWLKNQAEIDNRLTPGLDALAQNETNAEETLGNLKDEIQPLLKGAYPLQ